MRMRNRFSSLALIFLQAGSFILFALLSVAAFLRFSYVETNYNGIVLYKTDSFFMNLIFLALMLLVLYLIAKWVERGKERAKKILLVGVCLFIFSLSLGWNLVSKVVPFADQYTVYEIGKSFSMGYYEGISADGYLSVYPHQIGLVAFYELVFRLLHFDSYRVIACMNSVFATICVFCGFQMTEHMFRNQRVSTYYLLLVTVCFPFLFYTALVYGEIPSFAFLFFGGWMLLKHMDTNRPVSAVLAVLSLGGAVLLRKNSLIFVIACVLILLVQGIQSKKRSLFLLAFTIALISFSVLPLTQSYYENKTGSTLGEGTPAVAFIAMGLQNNSTLGPGMYNGYNYETYVNNGYNAKITSQLAVESIKSSVQSFAADPVSIYEFFRDKFALQWTEGSFSCFQLSVNHYGTASVLENIYYGKLHEKLVAFMNYYQFVIYAGGLIFCVLAFFDRKKNNIAKNNLGSYLPMAAILGGVIVFTFWEAAPRYVFPYFFLAIPYASAGLEGITRKVTGK